MISSVDIISDIDISKMFDIKEIVNVCQKVFSDIGVGKINSPHKYSLVLPGSSKEYMRWMNSMPAYLEGEQVVGIKWAGICSDNYKKGLPKINATIILNAMHTGMPFAILDGVLITHYRTAASVLLAAELYAPKYSRTITIIGPGEQARYTTLFLISKYDINKIYVVARNDDGYSNFKKFIQEHAEKEVKLSKPRDIETAVSQSDIIIASSTSKEPLLTKKEFRGCLNKNQFVCGLSGFYDVSKEILNLFDLLIFDSANARKRIEDACDVNFSKLEIKSITNMVSPVLNGERLGKNLYLPVGISAMDIALANYFYKKGCQLQTKLLRSVN